MTCPQCAELREKLEETEFRLSQLVKALEDQPVPAVANLTPHEAAICVMIRQKSPTPCSKYALLDMLAQLRGNREEPHVKVIDVFIHLSRKKLKPHGISIENVWGRGYFMDGDSIAKWDRLIELEGR